MKLCDVTCSGPAFLIDTFTYIHCELKKLDPFLFERNFGKCCKGKGSSFLTHSVVFIFV